MEAHYQHCLDLLKDSSIYPALLYLPHNVRGHVGAIRAFQNEIDLIEQLVSEPMPGEIRLQWWRDVISGERSGEGQANPLAKALLETIAEFSLPRQGFLRFLDAKVFDLYNDPMPDMAALEAYCGETESFVLQMSVLVCGAENSEILADACGHGGVAIGISKMLAALPFHARKQKVYVPRDVLEENGINPTVWIVADEMAEHRAVYVQMAKEGLEHSGQSRTAILQLDKPLRTAFLPLVIAETWLRHSFSMRGDPREQVVEVSPLRTQWQLWKAALFGF